jgi:DNA repair exonuclease SbcCD ATPase subunit
MGLAYLKSWSTVRDTPTEELQNRLRDALESLHEIADALECSEQNYMILDAIKQLCQDVEDNDEERDQAVADCATAKSERDEARERLKKKLQDEPDAQALREELAKVNAALSVANDRIRELDGLAEPYAAALAAARKFVSAIEGSGVKAKPVRRVNG